MTSTKLSNDNTVQFTSAQTSREVKKHLKKMFPHVEKLSVTCKNFSHGPSTKAIESATRIFEGATLEQNGADMIKGNKDLVEYNGKKIDFGIDYIFCERTLSPENEAIIVKYVQDKYGEDTSVNHHISEKRVWDLTKETDANDFAGLVWAPVETTIEEPNTEDITPEQMAELLPFAQEYSEHKQMERATFAAESALETVPMEQERQVVRVERRSEFSMCSTSWFYYHPECYSLQGTTPIEINELSHREVGSRAVCAECGESVHKAPEQVQRQEKQETDNQQQAYRHTFDQQHFFYYHKVCVEHNPPEVHFDLIPLGKVPQEAECDFCYQPVHGPSAYYATQEKEAKTKTKRKKGRPSQDKMIRHYTIDREVAEFIDKLPDGERSRFVNSLLKQGVENARRTNP